MTSPFDLESLVPKAGLEPARVASPPPQDGVSTRFHHFGTLFTTEALSTRRYSKIKTYKNNSSVQRYFVAGGWAGAG